MAEHFRVFESLKAFPNHIYKIMLIGLAERAQAAPFRFVTCPLDGTCTKCSHGLEGAELNANETWRETGRFPVHMPSKHDMFNLRPVINTVQSLRMFVTVCLFVNCSPPGCNGVWSGQRWCAHPWRGGCTAKGLPRATRFGLRQKFRLLRCLGLGGRVEVLVVLFAPLLPFCRRQLGERARRRQQRKLQSAAGVGFRPRRMRPLVGAGPGPSGRVP